MPQYLLNTKRFLVRALPRRRLSAVVGFAVSFVKRPQNRHLDAMAMCLLPSLLGETQAHLVFHPKNARQSFKQPDPAVAHRSGRDALRTVIKSPSARSRPAAPLAATEVLAAPNETPRLVSLALMHRPRLTMPAIACGPVLSGRPPPHHPRACERGVGLVPTTRRPNATTNTSLPRCSCMPARSASSPFPQAAATHTTEGRSAAPPH